MSAFEFNRIGGLRIGQEGVCDLESGRVVTIGPKFRLQQTTFVVCSCSCGNVFVARLNKIKRKTTKSCGCIVRDLLVSRNSTHGKHGTPEYVSWSCMKSRVGNENVHNHDNYGGRGIKVCDRWLGSFENFLEDMGPKPTPKHTIDRRDNSGDYTPDNCKWSTNTEQANNRRKRRSS